jgi:diguanylate cyclase (GGDEF)-like protein/PAS domain S-box-containing protein
MAKELSHRHRVLSTSVQPWLVALVFCGVAGILALALYGKWQVGRIYDSASYANVDTVPRIVALEDARAHFSRWRMALFRDAMGGGEPLGGALDVTIARELAATRASLDQYESLLQQNEKRDGVAAVRELIAGYERVVDSVDISRHDGRPRLAVSLLVANSASSDRIVEKLDGLIAENVAQGRAQGEDAFDAYQRTAWVTLAFVLLVAAALLIVGYVIGRKISTQVERIHALAQENEIFRTMIESLRDQAVIVHDIENDYRIVYANDAACRHFGVGLDTLLGWTPDVFDPHVTLEMLERRRAAWQEHGHDRFESEHRIASGELIPVEVASNLLEHEGLKLSICVVRDLRSRRAEEERMLEMERIATEREGIVRMARFARSAPGCMYTMEMRPDGELSMTYASASIQDVLGHSVDQLLSDIAHLEDLIIPEDLAHARAAKAISYEELSPFHAEMRILHPVKGVRWIEANSMPERAEDGIVTWYGYMHDVTERKSMEDKLARRERESRALSENSPDMIIRYDLGYRRIYVNQAFLDNTELRADEVIGKRVTELPWWPLNVSASEFENHLRRVAESGESISLRLYGNHPFSGEPRHTMARVVPELDGAGDIASLMAVVRDVTDLVHAEHELRQREQYLRALLDNFPFFVWLKDTESRLLAANVQFARVARVATTLELEGKTDFDLFPHELAQSYVEKDRAVLSSGETESLVELYRDEHDEMRWMETYKSRVVVDGEVIGTVGFSRDVTDQMHLQLDLAARERELRTLVENSPDVIIRYDRECRRVFVSPNFAQVYGIPVLEALGRKPTEAWGRPLMDPADYERRLRNVMHTGISDSIEMEWYTEAGDYVCQSLLAVPETDPSGLVGTVLTLSRDVSEIKRAERMLMAREWEFRTLVEHSPDTISRYDAQCRRIYANPKLVEECGRPLQELLGRTPSEAPGGDSAEAYHQRIQQVIDSGEPADFELRWRGAQGQEYCSHIRLTPEFDRASDKATGVLAVGRDITEIDEYRKRVHQMAFYDVLTQLPNRSLLNDRIGQTILEASYHGHRFGLMLLDLDGFKEVNDTLGHGVGDQLLCEVGERLLQCVRIYDTVARLGGDEFAVLLPEVREDGNLGQIARKILDGLADPFLIGGKEMFVSASIGIAIYPSDSAEVDGLFRYADSAMYHAKKQGRNNFQFYSAELTARSGERMALESDLRRARKKKELELHYQPQVDTLSGEWIGAEALLRWNRGGQERVTPDRFIGIAEETGLIVDIGEWVIESACEAAVAWNRGRRKPFKVAINLSTRQFIRNDLLGSVRTILRDTGCKPEWLGLEITESLLLEDAEHIRRMLMELHDMGFAIAIDDFGTGYSALGYLNRFPVSVLKIDRSFVRDITTDRDRAELVRGIVSMARSLRMELVAEGVETDAQLAYLSKLGCHAVQGYLFGKPMPQAEFEALLKT